MYDNPGSTMCQGREQHGAPGESLVMGQAAGASRKAWEMDLERETKPR